MLYKDTVILPRTAFPMRANLVQKEADILKNWADADLYNLIQKNRANAPEYIFHDGPPYANEHAHLGTAFNRVLKDMVIRYKIMAGYKVHFIPGWDCHGMPIEHAVIKKKGAKSFSSKNQLRQECKKYAEESVDIQRQEFKRLGTFADWDHPYITMSKEYEAKVLEVFKIMVSKGYIYRAKRPVHWCMKCRTALAEAELDYKDFTSPSVYVKFKILSMPETYILIWTTTPWTLPANVACAINSGFKYAFVKTEKETLIIADSLLPTVVEKLKIKDYKIEKTVLGKELGNIEYKHPFLDRTGKIILSSFVTSESGTGCVHIAPGHGYEDYLASITYNLPILSPVDEKGCFTEEVPELQGKNIFDADKDIIEILTNNGTLMYKEDFQHSYPHCWRCKTPLIFRATPQWFLNMEHNNLRTRCVEEIEKVKWMPEWSKKRITNNIMQRPDWCLSRQRSWGIPIPALYCKACGEAILTTEIIEKAIQLVKVNGTDIWFDENTKIDAVCPKCGNKEFKKEEDIFDVWIDSSSSYYAVVKEKLKFPANLYCEAVDQHRCWFQHSLILSMVTEEQSCFKSVLTHGLILDKEGKKMSKSQGNVVQPMEVIKKYGADIVRLYLSGLDYTCDIMFSTDGLETATTAYRKIRNTFKFLLGNLYDYKKALSYEKLWEVDKLMLHKLAVLIENVTKAYEEFEFYKVYHLIHNYCVMELSQFYFDTLKDRLYTHGKSSISRQSAQTVLSETLSALARLVAPILPFTSEEVWGYFNSGSIHLEKLPVVQEEWKNEKLANEYAVISEIRDEVLLALEQARANKTIGSGLEATVIIDSKDEKLLSLLRDKIALLPSIFIVSEVIVDRVENMVTFKKLDIKVNLCEYSKCERCWIREKEVGKNNEHPTLCVKCSKVIKEGDYEKEIEKKEPVEG